LSVVLFAFAGDLTPSGSQVEVLSSDLSRAPAYTVDQIPPAVVSLVGDCKGVREEALDAPYVVRSLWRKVHSDARLLYADAGADAHRLAERFSTPDENR
jgi:hypothetical protein